MGLDMYLYKKEWVGLSYEHNKKMGTDTKIVINDKEYSSENLDQLVYKVGYWRKANQIHKWFVDNVQRGEDNCGEYWVSKEKLKHLYNLCKEVLANKENAKELLPTEEGFFFGSTDYDDYYIGDLQETIEILEPIINENSNADYYYTSSW